MTSDLAFSGQDLDDICGKEELITFQNIPQVYAPGDPLTVHYTLGSQVVASSKDWIGLFPCGWNDTSQPVAFLWSTPPSKYGARSRKRSVTFSPELSKRVESSETSYQFVYMASNNDVMGVSQPFRVKKEEGPWCDDLEALANQESPDIDVISCDSDKECDVISCDSDKECDQQEKSVLTDSPVLLSSDEEWELATQSTIKHYSPSNSDLSDIVILSTSPSKEAARIQTEEANLLLDTTNSSREEESSEANAQDTLPVPNFIVIGGKNDRNPEIKDPEDIEKEKVCQEQSATLEDADECKRKVGRKNKLNSEFKTDEKAASNCRTLGGKQKSKKRRVAENLCSENGRIVRETEKSDDLEDEIFSNQPCRPSIFSQLKIVDTSDDDGDDGEDDGFPLQQESVKGKDVENQRKIQVISETLWRQRSDKKSESVKTSKLKLAKSMKNSNTVKGKDEGNTEVVDDRLETKCDNQRPTAIGKSGVLFDEMQDILDESEAASKSGDKEDSATKLMLFPLDLPQQTIPNGPSPKGKKCKLKKKKIHLKSQRTTEIAVAVVRDQSDHRRPHKSNISAGTDQPWIKERHQQLKPATIAEASEVKKPTMPNQEMKDLKKKYRQPQKAKAKKSKKALASLKAPMSYNLAFLFDVESKPIPEEHLEQPSDTSDGTALYHSSDSPDPSRSDNPGDVMISSTVLKDTSRSDNPGDVMISSTVLKDTSDEGFPALPVAKDAVRDSHDLHTRIPDVVIKTWSSVLKNEGQDKSDESERNGLVLKAPSQPSAVKLPTDSRTTVCLLEPLPPEENTTIDAAVQGMEREESKPTGCEDSEEIKPRGFEAYEEINPKGCVASEDTEPKGFEDSESNETSEEERPACSQDVPYIPSYVLDIMDALPPAMADPQTRLRSFSDWKKSFSPLMSSLPVSKFKAKYKTKSARRQEFRNLKMRRKLAVSLDSGIIERIMKTRFLGEMESQKIQVKKSNETTPTESSDEAKDQVVPDLSHYPALSATPIPHVNTPLLTYAGVFKKSSENCCCTNMAPGEEDKDSGVESCCTSLSDVPTKSSRIPCTTSTVTTLASQATTTSISSSDQPKNMSVVPFSELHTSPRLYSTASHTLNWPFPSFHRSSSKASLPCGVSSHLIPSIQVATSIASPSTLFRLSLGESTQHPVISQGESLGAYLRPGARVHTYLGEKGQVTLSKALGNLFDGDGGRTALTSPCHASLPLTPKLGKDTVCGSQDEQLAILDMALTTSLKENRELKSKVEFLETKLAELSNRSENVPSQEAQCPTSQLPANSSTALVSKKKVMQKGSLKRRVAVLKWKGQMAEMVKTNGELLSLKSKAKDVERELDVMRAQIGALKETLQAETELKMKALSKWFKLKLRFKSLKTQLKKQAAHNKTVTPFVFSAPDCHGAEVKDETSKDVEVTKEEGIEETEDYEPPAKKRKLATSKHEDIEPILLQRDNVLDLHLSKKKYRKEAAADCVLDLSSVLEESSEATREFGYFQCPGQVFPSSLQHENMTKFQAKLSSNDSVSMKNDFYNPLPAPVLIFKENDASTSKAVTFSPPIVPSCNQIHQPINEETGEQFENPHAYPKPQDLSQQHQKQKFYVERETYYSEPSPRYRRKPSPPHLPLPTPKLTSYSNTCFPQNNSPRYRGHFQTHQQQLSPRVKPYNTFKPKPFPYPQRPPSFKRTPPHLPLPPPAMFSNDFSSRQRNGKWADRSRTPPRSERFVPTSPATRKEFLQNQSHHVPSVKPFNTFEVYPTKPVAQGYSEPSDTVTRPGVWPSVQPLNSHSQTWPGPETNSCLQGAHLNEPGVSAGGVHSISRSKLIQQPPPPFYPNPARLTTPKPLDIIELDPGNQQRCLVSTYYGILHQLGGNVDNEKPFPLPQVTGRKFHPSTTAIGEKPFPSEAVMSGKSYSIPLVVNEKSTSSLPPMSEKPFLFPRSMGKTSYPIPKEVGKASYREDEKKFQQPQLPVAHRPEFQYQPVQREKLKGNCPEPWVNRCNSTTTGVPKIKPSQSPYVVYSLDRETFHHHEDLSDDSYLPSRGSALSVVENGRFLGKTHENIDKPHTMSFLFPENVPNLSDCPVLRFDEKQPNWPFLTPHLQRRGQQHQRGIGQIENQSGPPGGFANQVHDARIPNTQPVQNQGSTFYELSTGGLIDASQTGKEDLFPSKEIHNRVFKSTMNPGLIEAREAPERSTT